ncbi:MAG: xanthine dehydrogenase family protein molybdopterin-binding subunit [Gemmatimonadota bacterium]|nr:xanthine dehydrogenase family protein molybdopterin-binding subunit [Gemmatimonadota bacterium]
MSDAMRDAMRDAVSDASARYVATQVEVEGRVETRLVERPAIVLPPWEADATLAVVGQPVPRVDGPAKAAGRARYTADIVRPGMLHVAIRRAGVASGRVTRLDTAAARAVPGVRDILTAEEVGAAKLSGAAGRLLELRVAYAAHPVAAVCAESPEAARAGAEALVVEVTPEPFVLDVETALASGAPRVRGGASNAAFGSPVTRARGDVDAALAAAATVVTITVETPAALHCAMEPHGAVAEWDEGRLTVWEGTQGIFRVRENLARAFGLAQGDVRVIGEHMGGGFGAKNYAGPHTYLAALFARRLGRPVRCVLDRAGEQTDTGHRNATRQRVTAAADAAGRLVALDLTVDAPMGVGGWAASAAAVAHQMYDCPNVRSVERFAFTHVGAMDSFRAPGFVEGAVGVERAVDALAARLGADPLEFRRRHLAARDPDRDRPYSGNALDRCYVEAAERFRWADRRRALAAERARGRLGPVRRGIGVAAQVWGTGGGPPAHAICRLNPDGSAELLVGTQDLGTGIRTLCAQVAAEVLGVAPARIRVTIGDTAQTPYTNNSWGSITTPSVLPAVRMAAHDARTQYEEARATGAPLGNMQFLGRGTRGPNPDRTGVATFGVQFAEVEVDTGTGVVRVTELVAVHDAGRIVNPLLARSQLEGGILQGLGYALFEERVLDPATGTSLTRGLHDYKVPTMADVPVIDAWCVAGADPVANDVGARGLAEAPIIPTAPAIMNAVADALGVEPDALPLAPWRVLRWIGRDGPPSPP